MTRILRISTALVAALLLTGLTATAAFAQDQIVVQDQDVTQVAKNYNDTSQTAVAVSGDSVAVNDTTIDSLAASASGDAGAANLNSTTQTNVQTNVQAAIRDILLFF